MRPGCAYGAGPNKQRAEIADVVAAVLIAALIEIPALRVTQHAALEQIRDRLLDCGVLGLLFVELQRQTWRANTGRIELDQLPRINRVEPCVSRAIGVAPE